MAAARAWTGWQELLATPTPWGAEAVWAHTDTYAAKLLQVDAGQALSLQYHRGKRETMLCLTGKALILIGTQLHLMQQGGVWHIECGTPHRLAAITDTLVVEVSTPELGDVVRLLDEHGRATEVPATAVPPDPREPLTRRMRQPSAEGRNHTPMTEYKAPMARDHRLASIAIMLASGQRLRASELARRFGVSERTVYRDMQRLSDQGFPLAAIPGPSGGYAIFATTGAKHVQLELDEAVTLAIGAALAIQVLYREDNGAARRALQKIQDSMPDTISCALPDLLDLFADSPVRRPPRSGRP